MFNCIGPGFLNGLTALANATTNCFPMILTVDRQSGIVDLQQGDYEEMDQLAIAKPLCKAAFRVLHPKILGLVLHALFGPLCLVDGWSLLDCPPSFCQTMDAGGQNSLVKVVDAAPRQLLHKSQ